MRVVVADDSPFVCHLLTSHLAQEGGFQIVGVARDGQAAISMVLHERPDVVTLDLEMPRVNGLEVLEVVMRDQPTPVIMVSGISRQAALVTMRALELGAVDFILKFTPGVDTDPEAFRREFVAKVRAAAGVKVIRSLGQRHPAATVAQRLNHRSSVSGSGPTHLSAPTANVDSGRILVVGASTGGPMALRELLAELGTDFPAPIVIVQHMPATFTGVLAAQLDRQVPLHVREAVAGDALAPGTAYIAPGGQHLLVNRDGRIEIMPGPKVNGHCPSVDVTMQSAAVAFPGRADGVVLTGMGDDGTAGLAFLRSKGGRTYAQDEASCVVYGMPQRAIERGVVDCVGTPAAIGRELARLAATTAAPRTIVNNTPPVARPRPVALTLPAHIAAPIRLGGTER